MAFIDIGGQLLHYRDRGDPGATAILFCNSLGTDFRLWDRVEPEFADRFRTLCYDKRGHGLSAAPDAPYRMQDHVDDARGLLDALGVGEFVVCGDSVGGLIAQGLAHGAGDRCRGLVLCDTAARIGSADMWDQRVAAARAGGVEALADATMERWFSADWRSNRPTEVAGWRNMLVRTPLEGFVGTMLAIRDCDYSAATGDLRIPVMAVVGEEDGSTPPEVVRGLAELVPGADFHVIPGAGHLPCVDQPEALVRLMNAFFERHRLAG